MKGAAGRSESRLYRFVIYVIATLGVLPVVMPLYWLTLASLKSNERSAVNPPDWLPLDVDHTVDIAGQPVPVNIFDDARTSGSGVMRVKMTPGAAIELPDGEIEVEREQTWLAEIDGITRRVIPVNDASTADEALLTVALLGTRRAARIPTAQIEVIARDLTFWMLLGEEIPVELLQPAEGNEPAFIRVPPSVEPLPVAPELYTPGVPGVVTWRGRSIPVELIAERTEAGYLLVRPIAPTSGLAVPADELRQQSQVELFAPIDRRRREVKRLENLPDGTTRIEIVGQPEVVRIPAVMLQRREALVYFAHILDELRPVEPYDRSAPTDAAASTRLFVPGALSVAASQVRTTSRVEPQWQNYALAWKEQSFDLYIANTLFIAAFVVAGTILSCGLVGYAFARLEFRGRGVLFLILLSTMMIPGQVLSIPTFVLFAKFGWLDTYKPLIVPHFLAYSAFFVFLFRQFMMTIPVDLEDAARIDGCGPLATWWLVMMPLSKPIIITVAVFSFTYVWNDFLYPLLYINSDEKQTVALGLQNFKSAFQGTDPQLIMAASVMMIIPTVLLFLVAQKAFMRGVVVTGVKG